MKEIKTLTYRDDHGQDQTYTVGKYGVTAIVEHASQGQGDKWYYDVLRGTETERIFDFTRVTF